MSFYTRVFNALPLSFARAAPLKAEFDRIAQGFAAAEVKYDATHAAEIAAREGQASLLDNLKRVLATFRPATGHMDMGGFRLRNLGNPELGSDAATKDFVVGAVVAPGIPDAVNNTGKVMRAMASGLPGWSDVWGPALVATNGMTLAARGNYTVDTSGGPVSLTMPPSPVAGDWVRIRDLAGNAGTNNITLIRNGAQFMGLAEDYIMDVSREVLIPEFTNTKGWVRA